jgi:AraC-like DNA-binding protein
MRNEKHPKHGRFKINGKFLPYESAKTMLDNLVGNNLTMKQIAVECGVTLYTINNWFTTFGIRRGMSSSGRESISQKLKARHAETGYMSGDNHWSHGRLRLRGEWVSHDEAKLALAELVEQDMTIAQIAEECGTDYKTITNWLTRFDMHKGIRSGSRCSWFKGGHQKYRGPGWLTLRKDILERDGYKCRVCNETQDEAREKGHPLNVHHIVPWEVSQDNSPDNLITLCQPCHMREEWSNGRHSNGNNNLTQ